MQTIDLDHEDLEELRQTYENYIAQKVTPSISMFLNEDFEHQFEKIDNVNLEEMEKLIANFWGESSVSAVYVRCTGDISIGIIYCFPEEKGKQLAAKLLGERSCSDFTSLEISSLSELGNILSGSFFNGINDNCGYVTESSVPGFAIDTFRGLIESPALDAGVHSHSIIVCSMVLKGMTGLEIRMMLLQDPHEAKKLLDKKP